MSLELKLRDGSVLKTYMAAVEWKSVNVLYHLVFGIPKLNQGHLLDIVVLITIRAFVAIHHGD